MFFRQDSWIVQDSDYKINKDIFQYIDIISKTYVNVPFLFFNVSKVIVTLLNEN